MTFISRISYQTNIACFTHSPWTAGYKMENAFPQTIGQHSMQMSIYLYLYLCLVKTFAVARDNKILDVLFALPVEQCESRNSFP